MTDVTRLQGQTHFGSYIVGIFVENGRVNKIEISGRPHKEVTEICNAIANSKTKLVDDSIKAIKFTMTKHFEYKGEKRQ